MLAVLATKHDDFFSKPERTWAGVSESAMPPTFRWTKFRRLCAKYDRQHARQQAESGTCRNAQDAKNIAINYECTCTQSMNKIIRVGGHFVLRRVGRDLSYERAVLSDRTAETQTRNMRSSAPPDKLRNTSRLLTFRNFRRTTNILLACR